MKITFTTQELIDWLLAQAKLCDDIAKEPCTAMDVIGSVEWWRNEASRYRETAQRLSGYE